MRDLSRKPTLRALTRRHAGGFTLVEVLIAASIMVVALAGILSLAFTSLRKSDVPENVQGAIAAAQERLDYFRGQPNPYKAAGGTYYLPPQTRNEPDFNTGPFGTNINTYFDANPALFVREYLYSFNEGRGMVDNPGAPRDAGRGNTQTRGSLGAGAVPAFAANEIPPTVASLPVGAMGAPVTINGILPNQDRRAAPNYQQGIFVGVVTNLSPPPAQFLFTWAPRANDNLRHLSPLPPSIKFVREVWIQTNHPQFGGNRCADNANSNTTTMLGNLGGLQFRPPAFQTNLPPYVVGVTVRVFARDTATTVIDLTDLGTGPDGLPIVNNGNVPISGPGYDRGKPLAEMVGYYGLRRMQ